VTKISGVFRGCSHMSEYCYVFSLVSLQPRSVRCVVCGGYIERYVESVRREIGVQKKCRIRSITLRPNYFNSEGNETWEQRAVGLVFLLRT
jgi:DNA repair photolyase